MTEPSITPDLVERVASLAGLAVPDDDLDLLKAALANHVASSGALRSLELDDIEPIVSFDPRWQ